MDAYDLLNINREIIEDFSLQSLRVEDPYIEKKMNFNIKRLNDIGQRMMSNDGLKVSQQSIEEVMYKVVTLYNEHNYDINCWTMRELRIISYNIMRLQNDENIYKFALKLLDSGWKDLYLNGLVFYVVNSWTNIKPILRKSTCQLIIKKLEIYDGNNKKYILWKNHINLFDEAGPIRMAMILVSKRQDIMDAPLLIGNKPSSLSQLYYSDVIVKFSSYIDIEKLDDIFSIHSHKRTKQLVFANLVERAENSKDAVLQSQLSKLINRELGDITLTSTWAPFSGATEEEAQKLKKTMLLVNLWFTKKIIETFFDICVQDYSRETFWLKYVNYISGFRIVGSRLTKRSLQADNRINTMFQKYFIETNSTTSQTSALVLYIKGMIFIEFSDVGALYVYEKNDYIENLLKGNGQYISSINDLKISTMQNLVENYYGNIYYNDYGRMIHRGDWEYRLGKWMRIKILPFNNVQSSQIDTSDDAIFKAKPLKEEAPINKPVYVEKETLAVETQIYCNIHSMWILNNRLRIGCNSNGYYINYYKNGNKYIKISELVGKSPTGNIWIRRPNSGGWSQIVHSTFNSEFEVGFIKDNGSYISFIKTLDQYDETPIYLL